MASKVIIMGAAGRDFHNFNVHFRDNDAYEVVAFTATQIPDIEGRVYPPVLAGKLYPQGIPIHAEEELSELIKKHNVEQVIFAYSDISHAELMNKASLVLAAGADFRLMGPSTTMLRSSKPVVAVTATRTGVGKSQTTRKVCDVLKAMGKKVVAVRHPMPYGDLAKQVCQRFETYADLDLHKCTIEEREEYEPHIDRGIIVYAGVDYARILAEAEKEADIIVWDGGNNDFSFYQADLYITLVDPHRPGHEVNYHPGETNLRMADVVVINKIETASPEGISTVRASIERCCPDAVVIEAASPIFVEEGHKIRGKRVLVIEDGPTLTHGEMAYGAGMVAARKYGAGEIIDPRPWAVGSIKDTFAKYRHLQDVLPAMGYGDRQIAELEQTINAIDCDLVIAATPIDLTRVLKISKPAVRVRYELQEIGSPTLEEVLAKFK
ncbi:MAG: GTPase [Firmicutes bacterium]|nr:GTPase [Bacillota bacterium]HOB34546.1 cyclic 2,3-diphosphoglycerate synthase [Bacillota bacterium]HPZ91071.1 cyclic 2,3-diphosphoglycerate synthase [Bacillota bacterium]HQE01894.1 cyclic 2,3-diphosphoglycerate synthase [Bacillota bacterium]